MQSRLRPSVVLAAIALGGCATAGGARSERAERRDRSRQTITEVVVGAAHSCVLLSSGRVRCWGDNSHGQLGDGTRWTHYTPRDVPGQDEAVDIAARGNATCAVDRTGHVACWGSRLQRRYRAGVPYVATDHQTTRPEPVAGIADAKSVAVGGDHACVVHAGGGVSCWGAVPGRKQDDSDHANTAVKIAIDDVAQVVAGSDFSCARKSDGTTWCWGSSGYGVVPRPENDGEDEPVNCDDACLLTPVLVDLPKLATLHAGRSHSCGVTDDPDRHLVCWGWSLGCTFGAPIPYGERGKPTTVPGVRDVVAIAGPQCVVDETGVLCWKEQRADSYSPHYNAPTICTGQRHPFEQARSAAVGSEHGCAVVGNELRCWGSGAMGQLGHGQRGNAAAPVPVDMLFAADPPKKDPHATLVAALPNKPLEGFALVYQDAPMFSRAGDDAGDRVGSLLAPREPDSPPTGQRLTVEILGSDAGFAHVRLLSPHEAKAHCGASSVGSLAPYALEFFVRRRDLVPVVDTEYADSHDDGSIVFLAPGTPIATDELGIAARSHGLPVPLYLQAEDVGQSYRPKPLADADPPLRYRHHLDGSVEVSLLGRTLELAQISGDDDFLRRWAATDDGEESRLILGDQCGRFEVVIDPAVIEPPPSGGGRGGGGIGYLGSGDTPTPKTWIIDEGTRTVWPDGRPAGKTNSRRSTTAAPREVGGRLCWAVSASLELCHVAGDITVVPATTPKTSESAPP